MKNDMETGNKPEDHASKYVSISFSMFLSI